MGFGPGGRLRIPKLLVVLTAALGLTTVMATPVLASASGCVYSDPTPASCISVVGSSLWVDSVTGGVLLSPRQSTRGHWDILDHDGKINKVTADFTYWNQSWVLYHTFWGPQFGIKKNVPDGDQICATFWELHGGGYVHHNPACETVHL